MHPDFVKSIALAGPYVVTGGRQETVRVWSVAVGFILYTATSGLDETGVMLLINVVCFLNVVIDG